MTLPQERASKTVLLLATTTGYQIRAFGEAAERLGIRLLFATDRCDQLEDPWWDGALPVRFDRAGTVQEALDLTARARQVHGILAVGDGPTVAAAYAARHLSLPGNTVSAAEAARDKRLTRDRLRDAGLPVPEFIVLPRDTPPDTLSVPFPFPVVAKPAVLSGSRGVIRADTSDELRVALRRVQQLLLATDVRALQDPAADDVIVESFIPGDEYALEGVLTHGRLKTLAIFDKPDPLDGPFFEETLYVTPSRAPVERQQRIATTIEAAARAIGLTHGPVHAECRVNASGVYVLEVAARPIGGLCARSLTFVNARGDSASLEELLLRHAVGESVDSWEREAGASGVMMIPIPRGGIYRGVHGVEEARAVPHVCDVRITAKPDQQLVPLPEGASYLGFIFARAATPQEVEQALRASHERLQFRIDRALPVVPGAGATID
jgi:biotin carboxylase